MKNFSKLVGIGISIIGIICIIVAGYYSVLYFTASLRGQANAENQIESAPNRITSYNHFYDLCASIQSYEGSLKAQKKELKQATSQDDKSRIRANIAGIKAQRYRAITQYNQDARKSYTMARFLGKKLPKHINPNQKEITCEQR